MNAFLQLTYSGLFLAVLAQQAGLPIPSVVFLMAAGALSAHGRMNPAVIVAFGVLGCLAGDALWFWIGRKWGSKAMRLFCQFTADPRNCSKGAQEKFRRHGLPLMCIAKFVPGLDAVLPPLCGAEGVSVAGFFAFDALGSLLWSCAYVGLGYLFSNELERAIHWVERFGTILGIGVGVPIVLYAGWRGVILARMIYELRGRRISPTTLARKLKSNGKVAVLDLANFEEHDGSDGLEAIPGAIVVDPLVLRNAGEIAVPEDVNVILYSPSGSDAVSARVAVGLKRIGVDKVWVLEGGMKAWREHGLPVSQSPELPESVAKRLGVTLPEPNARPN